MEHESFEERGVAAVLNEHFVSIKVDREERPDVDRVYMTFVQGTTGSGGWPMSVWLTPALKPFFGGTYFPPTSRWGRPGFVEILQQIAQVWRADRDKIEQSAASVTEQLRGSIHATVVGGRAVGRRAAADRRAVSIVVRPRVTAALATRRNFRGRASCCSCCASTRARATATRCRSCWPRCARWRSAACATTSAAASIATRSTPPGACRTSRRCCTTRRSSCSRTSRRRRRPAIRSTSRSPRTRCAT